MNPTAIFLREDVNWDVEPEIITEETRKTFFIKSPTAIQVDKMNKNGRIYKNYIVENELNKRYIPEFVNDGKAWGELGHPDSHRIIERNISHRFVEINKTNSNYYGIKAKVVNTPNGNIIQALLEDKEGKMGTSTRAIGSVKSESGKNYVQEDFHLITAGDVVTDPSAQMAFINGLMENHNKYYTLVDNQIVEIIKEDIKKEYKENLPIEKKRELLINNFKNLFNQNIIKEGIFNSILMNLLSELEKARVKYELLSDGIKFEVDEYNAAIPGINGLYEFNKKTFYSLGRCKNVEELKPETSYRHFTTNNLKIIFDLKYGTWTVLIYDK